MGVKQPSQNFTKQLEALKQHISHAEMHFQIWRIYKQDREKYVDTMNVYLQFFRASISAHFIAMILALAKIHENNPKTCNFHRLLRSIDDDQLQKELNGLYKTKLESPLKKISLLRNNIFAHKNEKNEDQDYFRDAKISINEIKKVIADLIKIYDIISENKSLAPYNLHFFSAEAKKHTHSLLTSLSKG